ncbi:MAG: TIGR04282 family arsenosugar biosynthesis glycosyltransferase [Magnetococcales bacterium]|nr:TIGR04282 family arsenosugar biosynthesis glycosyltransferase [Magnetococcales bacterium]
MGAPFPVSLNILVRAPEAGQVKTRLIPLLGPEGAARAHERIVTHVVTTALSWAGESPARHVLLWCTPDTRHPFFDSLLPVDQRRLQPTGDLGIRLAGITADQIRSRQGVILLGGDAGSLTQDVLDQAESQLLGNDAVMAPAEDGGYILLALKRFHPMLFQGITWGSARVAAETRDRLVTLGWPWQELPLQWDVDRPGDWRRFQRRVIGP